MKFPGGEKSSAGSSGAGGEARGEKVKLAEESSLNDSFSYNRTLFLLLLKKSCTDIFVINVRKHLWSQSDGFLLINFLEKKLLISLGEINNKAEIE